MKNYKIIDTFMFNGEFEMLKMRLDYFYSSVDHFVICESDYTQSGNKKNLTYPGNEHLFSQYLDKIHYLVFTPTQEDIDKLLENRFHLEQKHMDFIRDNCLHLSDDNTMTMISGVDEFPDKNLFDIVWNRIKDMNMDAISFKMKTFYCSPLCELDIDCFATTVVNNYTFRNMGRFSDLRLYCFQSPNITGGWHLSFFHTPIEIKNKIENYSHSEYNNPDITNLENIKYRVYNQLDVLNRPEIKVIKHDKISSDFPLEFYRHEIFFRNNFEKSYLKPQMVIRKNLSSQIPLEIESLQLEVAKSNPKIVLEIGTAKGGTLARWFEIPSVETIISIDYPLGIHGGCGFEERTYVISDCLEQANLTKKEFYAVNGDSKDPYLINRVMELLNGRKVDFLFIDGDHTYEGVKNDFEIYRQFIHENSLVGFHDIIDNQFHREVGCFVSTLWDNLKKEYPYHEFIHSNLLDEKVTPELYSISHYRGGFGGIGIIQYEKVKNKNISLIIPIYNNVNLALKHLNQILDTSTLIDDVILYSNGSNDIENDILINYGSNNSSVRIFIEKRQIGYVKAVNESIKLAKNELILCINSDAVLFGDWESLLKPIWGDTQNGLLGPVLCDDFILGCCFMMKKSVMNKVGMLNEGFGLGYFDDGEISDRVSRNGYNLGHYMAVKSSDWPNITIPFPLSHIQGVSFMHVDSNRKKEEYDINKLKWENLKNSNTIKVYKNFDYESLKQVLVEGEVSVVVNESGDNFEKIRYDQDIIRKSNIFECTPEMNIDLLIDSICKKKEMILVDQFELTIN